jgi:uroporphyrinogen-III synthase
MKTVFISQDGDLQKELIEFCSKNQFNLIAKSLIDFKQVIAIFPNQQAQIVFFTSPRSVEFFFRQKQLKQSQQVACIGKTTKLALENHNIQVDFCSKNEKTPTLVAEEFSTWVGDKIVLFPLSNRSNKSMQKRLNPHQIQDVVVYETILNPQKIEPIPDILIFSSPSNVDSFLMLNKIHENQKLFSWGETTQNHLLEKSFKSKIYTSPNSLV